MICADIKSVLVFHLGISFHLIQAFVVQVMPTALGCDTAYHEFLGNWEQLIRVSDILGQVFELF